jgi:hypothetical protein
MTKEQLKDKAYFIATGVFLTENLSFANYDVLREEQLECLICEDAETLGASYVSLLIENIAKGIETEFEEFVDE